MSEHPHTPSWRKPAGMLMIIALIGGYAWGVVTVLERAGNLPTWLLIPIYAIAGVAWIVPLRPLLLWMETGRWRHFPDA